MSATAIDSIVVLGPTASGKTALAVHLAREFNGEIVSADSRQVYRGLDIGSGKDLCEYGDVPYHLIDIADLDLEYSVFDFQRDAYAAIDAMRVRQRLPIIAGGTGMYLEAVVQGYAMGYAPENPALRAELAALDEAELAARLLELRPAVHNTTDLRDRDRLMRAIEVATVNGEHQPPAPRLLAPVVLGMRWPRPVLHDRIGRRLRKRLDAGLVEEVESLIARGVSPERLCALGLEYRFVTEFLEGTIRNRNDLYQKLRAAIVNFAKRQETWFRRMERRGTRIRWIDRAKPNEAIAAVQQTMRAPV